jgi:MFS family permease
VTVAAKLVVRLGFRRTALAGAALIALGSVCLYLGSALPSVEAFLFLAGLVVMGLGMGPTVLCYTLAAQNAVDWGRRGVATGVILFSRTMGGALMVGLLGASLGVMLHQELRARQALNIDVTAALRPELHGQLQPSDLERVRSALRASLRSLFVQMAGLGLGGTLIAALLPHGTRTKAAPLATDSLDDP